VGGKKVMGAQQKFKKANKKSKLRRPGSVENENNKRRQPPTEKKKTLS